MANHQNMNELLSYNEKLLGLFSFEPESEIPKGISLFKSKEFRILSETKKNVFLEIGGYKLALAKNKPDESFIGCSCTLVDHTLNQTCQHIICTLMYWYEKKGLGMARSLFLQDLKLNEVKPYSIPKGDFDKSNFIKFKMAVERAMWILSGPFYMDAKLLDPIENKWNITVQSALSIWEVFEVNLGEQNGNYIFTCNCQCTIEGKMCIHIYRAIKYIFSNEVLLKKITRTGTADVDGEQVTHLSSPELLENTIEPTFPKTTIIERIAINTGIVTESFHAVKSEDWLELTGSIAWGSLDVSLLTIVKAIRHGQDHVLLPDQTVGQIPDKLIKKIKALLSTAQITKNAVRVRDINVSLIESFMIHEPFIAELKKKVQALDKGSILELTKDIAQPMGLKATLREYQLEGFRHFVHFSKQGWGMCLNDDMGLGKTIQSIAYLCYHKEKEKGIKALVVSPVSVMRNWGSEIDKFSPALSYNVYHGKDRCDTLSGDTDVTITSYSIVNNDIDILSKVAWDVIIIDEAHHIRNLKSLRTQRVLQLKAKVRFALTGTLIQNSIKDLFPVFDFMNPGIFGTIHKFKSDTSGIDERLDRKQLKAIGQKVSQFTLRRRKEEVAKDLPERVEETLYIEMKESEQELYFYLLEIYQAVISGELKDGGGGNRFHTTLLPIINKLRFACDSSILLKKERYENTGLVFKRESSKIDVLMDRVMEILSNNASGRTSKILVFSMFTSFLDVIESLLNENQMNFYRIDGSVDDKKRKKIQDAINDPDDKVSICLVSITAGGEGMNLQGANYIFIMDPHWNPAIEKQAYGRAHRIGQEQTVFVYRLVCVNTIEEKIIQLQERKKFIASSVEEDQAGEIIMEGEGSGTPSQEDIRLMFGIKEY